MKIKQQVNVLNFILYNSKIQRIQNHIFLDCSLLSISLFFTVFSSIDAPHLDRLALFTSPSRFLALSFSLSILQGNHISSELLKVFFPTLLSCFHIFLQQCSSLCDSMKSFMKERENDVKKREDDVKKTKTYNKIKI